MAGGVISTAPIFGLTIRESANDGSDFTNAPADYRRMFVGEDGLFHLKDSAGAVTTPSASSGAVTSSGLTMATGRLLGRTTASTGAVEEITVGSGLSLSAGSLTATGGGAVPDAHGARVKRASGDFSVGNNTLTAVEFTAEDLDTDTMHDNSTNPSRLTIPTITGVTTGLWSIKASGYTDQNSSASDVLIRLGGSTAIAFARFPGTAGAGLTSYVIAVDYVFSATNYVECLVRTTGASGNVTFDAGVSPLFEIAFLGKVS